MPQPNFLNNLLRRIREFRFPGMSGKEVAESLSLRYQDLMRLENGGTSHFSERYRKVFVFDYDLDNEYCNVVDHLNDVASNGPLPMDGTTTCPLLTALGCLTTVTPAQPSCLLMLEPIPAEFVLDPRIDKVVILASAFQDACATMEWASVPESRGKILDAVGANPERFRVIDKHPGRVAFGSFRMISSLFMTYKAGPFWVSTADEKRMSAEFRNFKQYWDGGHLGQAARDRLETDKAFSDMKQSFHRHATFLAWMLQRKSAATDLKDPRVIRLALHFLAGDKFANPLDPKSPDNAPIVNAALDLIRNFVGEGGSLQ